MQHYRITSAGDQASRTPALCFDAADVSEALKKVADHQGSAPVELWCDGQMLGRLEIHEGEEGSFWRLA
jgi:hypothetical protein